MVWGRKTASVNREMSPTDTMVDGNLERYMSVGRSALDAIKAGIGEDAAPRTVLDLPCGHGRVLRHLRAAYSDATIYACDTDAAGAAFCAATFGARVLPASTELGALDYGQTFDLIWTGSLITHLDAAATAGFFAFVARHLGPSGRAVVTSHGSFVAGRMSGGHGYGHPIYGIPLDRERGILSGYLTSGFGFGLYPGSADYGISVMSKAWLEAATATAGLTILSFHEHQWDNHQDVMTLALRR